MHLDRNYPPQIEPVMVEKDVPWGTLRSSFIILERQRLLPPEVRIISGVVLFSDRISPLTNAHNSLSY